MCAHIILKNTVEGGEHEEIIIESVGNIKTVDNCLLIYSNAILEVHLATGKFFYQKL